MIKRLFALLLPLVLTHSALAQAAPELEPRVFGTVRMGPVGSTVVRLPTRELGGAPVAAPGLGGRLDVTVLPTLLVGLELGLLFEGENMLRPYGPAMDGSELQLDGLVLDSVVSVRPLWRLDHGRIELFLSAGVGVTARPDLSGALPLTDATGATQVETGWSSSGWGGLAQTGAGATFWLSRRIGVFFEATVIARRVIAVVEQPQRGDFMLVMDELHGTLITGVGARLGRL